MKKNHRWGHVAVLNAGAGSRLSKGETKRPLSTGKFQKVCWFFGNPRDTPFVRETVRLCNHSSLVTANTEAKSHHWLGVGVRLLGGIQEGISNQREPCKANENNDILKNKMKRQEMQ